MASPWETVEPPPDDRESPYKGLAPYSERDAEWFFGRDSQSRIVATNLMSARITVLYAGSGVGKTSVLRAGVMPLLRREARRDLGATGRVDFVVALHNQWQDAPIPTLLASIHASIADACADEERPVPVVSSGHLGTALSEYARALDRDLLLILDQFEDWFPEHQRTGVGDPAGDELVHTMANLSLPVHYLVSLREDALAQLDWFKGRVPGVFDNLLRLRHLDSTAARQAIKGPLQRYNDFHRAAHIEIDETVVERVLTDVRTGSVLVGQQRPGTVDGNGSPELSENIEAPFLQLVMTRLWDEERAADSRRIQLDTLDRLGGAERIVGTYLDETIDRLDHDHRILAAEVFNHLVTPSGTKVAHSASDLAGYTGTSEASIDSLLEGLVRLRILRPLAPMPTHGRSTRYEIFHDVLAAPVLHWRTQYELEQRAERLEREKEEANAHAEEERRKARTFRALAVGFGILLVLTIAATIVAFIQRSTALHEAGIANRKSRLAHSETLRARAAAEIPINPLVGLTLAVEAARISPAPSARNLLRRSLSHLGAPVLAGDETLANATFNPGGNRIVAVGPHGSGSLWNARTGTLIRGLATQGDISSAAFSPDGRLLATADLSGHLSIWNAATGILRQAVLRPGPLLCVRFSPDGHRLLTGGLLDGGSIWTVTDGKASLKTSGLTQDPPVFTASFGPAGTVITLNTRGDLSFTYVDRTGVHSIPIPQTMSGEPERRLMNPYLASVEREGQMLVTSSSSRSLDLAGVWRLSLRSALGPRQLGGHPARERTLAATLAATLRGHTGPLTSAAFSPDGTKVITSSIDGTARIWNAMTGTSLHVLKAHGGPVLDAQIDRSGRFAVTAEADGTAHVWNARTGKSLYVLNTSRTKASPLAADVLASADFSPSGASILTDTTRGLAQLWSTRTGRLELTLGAGEQRH